MVPRRFQLWQCIASVGHVVGLCPSHSHLARPPGMSLPFVSHATESARHHHFSSIPNFQEAAVSETKWHELPPVPKQGRKWTAWELNKANRNSEERGPDVRDNENGIDYGVKQITARQWVTKCCPSLPSSLLHKLFRVRQVRQRTPPPGTQHQGRPSGTPAMEQLATRMRRVSVKAVLEEGTVLYLPRSVLQYQADILPGHNSKKTQHQPTAAEFAWLQSLVLYKDAEILVINKPPGLPVQGGSQIKKSLDSLMGTALSFDYGDGPRLVILKKSLNANVSYHEKELLKGPLRLSFWEMLVVLKVHRLDKETSGLMILARTQECAMLLHTLFREKTATATENENDNTPISRVYWALVIGTPKQPQGRISVPLMKVVLDEGKVDKIMVCHDFSNENAQVAITDYKVISPSDHGCTWLELHPVTGRKHQLRVHCAEVLGTPVLGDMKYGWRTQKEWLKKMTSEGSQTFAFDGATESTERKDPLEVKYMKVANAKIPSKVPPLHLHCREMVIPNVSQMLEMNRSTLSYVDVNIDHLQILAPLPPHMAASRNIWAKNISAASN